MPAHPVQGEARAEQLAQQFHETYERLAPSFAYETRPDSAVPWSNVPDRNKRLMVAVAAEILAGWDAHTAHAAAEVEQLKARDLPFELRWSPGGGWCVGWATGQPGRWQSAEHAPTLSDAIRNALSDARLIEHGTEGTG